MGMYYRLKNKITGKYFCQVADQIAEANQEDSIIYTEKVAKKILAQANQTGAIFTLSKKEFDEIKDTDGMDKVVKSFPGYELEKVDLLTTPIPLIFERKIKENALAKSISYTQSRLEKMRHVVYFLSQRARYIPIHDPNYPKVDNPFADDDKDEEGQ